MLYRKYNHQTNSQISIVCDHSSTNSFGMSVDLAKVNQYSERLHQGISETSELIEFRHSFPDKFRELCKVHLSFLIEIPCDFLDSESEEVVHSKSSIARFFSTKTPVTQKNEPISEKVVDNVTQLLNFLHEDSNISVEGLFRKSGNLTRQRDLRTRVLSAQPLPPFEAGYYNVHDVAGAVKSVLADLSEPLLTSRFLDLFAQIANLSSTNCDDNGVEVPRSEVDILIVRGKQLKALRILILLLPESNRLLLDRIMGLLGSASRCDDNRMSAQSLGTLFGPLLLTPKKMSSKELRSLYPVVNELATFMIDWGSGLFLVPRTLAEDVASNYRRLQANRRIQQTPTSWRGQSGDHPGTSAAKIASCSQLIMDDEDALVTGIAFTERNRSLSLSQLPYTTPSPAAPSTASTDTQFAVAELYARIQKLPDSSQKRRLVAKFNQLNGGLTPLDSAEFVRSTSHARGLRSSLRKRLKIPPTTPISAKLAYSDRSLACLRTPLTSIQDSPEAPGPFPHQSMADTYTECKRRHLCYPLGAGGSPFKRKHTLVTPSSIIDPKSTPPSSTGKSRTARLLRMRCISSPKSLQFSDHAERSLSPQKTCSPLPNLSGLFNSPRTPQTSLLV